MGRWGARCSEGEGGGDGDVNRSPWWGLERRVIELQDWRMELEIRLAGAILRLPRIGLLRADECGLTAEAFDRPDALLMYQAVRCCRWAGTIDDRTTVLRTARCALQSWGLWLDRPAHPGERGLLWSDANLVNLACGGAAGTGGFGNDEDGDDGPGDVVDYAPQLIDLDRRVREGRELWRRMYELFDEGRLRYVVKRFDTGRRMKCEG